MENMTLKERLQDLEDRYRSWNYFGWSSEPGRSAKRSEDRLAKRCDACAGALRSVMHLYRCAVNVPGACGARKLGCSPLRKALISARELMCQVLIESDSESLDAGSWFTEWRDGAMKDEWVFVTGGLRRMVEGDVPMGEYSGDILRLEKLLIERDIGKGAWIDNLERCLANFQKLEASLGKAEALAEKCQEGYDSLAAVGSCECCPPLLPPHQRPWRQRVGEEPSSKTTELEQS